MLCAQSYESEHGRKKPAHVAQYWSVSFGRAPLRSERERHWKVAMQISPIVFAIVPHSLHQLMTKQNLLNTSSRHMLKKVMVKGPARILCQGNPAVFSRRVESFSCSRKTPISTSPRSSGVNVEKGRSVLVADILHSLVWKGILWSVDELKDDVEVANFCTKTQDTSHSATRGRSNHPDNIKVSTRTTFLSGEE